MGNSMGYFNEKVVYGKLLFWKLVLDCIVVGCLVEWYWGSYKIFVNVYYWYIW